MTLEVEPLLISQSLVWQRPSGDRVAIRVCKYRDARTTAQLKGLYARERFALSHLSDLAVPSVVRLPASVRARIAGARGGAVLARSFVPGVPLDQAQLTVAQRLAVLLFVAEQLAAMRYRQVVVTCVSAASVIVDLERGACALIDLASVVGESLDDRYPNDGRVRSIFQMQAPEVGRAPHLTERAFVYQLGMLAIDLFAPGASNARRTQSLRAAQAVLREGGAARVASVLPRLVALDPRERPAGYAACFELLDRAAATLPLDAATFLKNLRAPYVQALRYR